MILVCARYPMKLQFIILMRLIQVKWQTIEIQHFLILVARHNMSNEIELIPVSEEEAMRFACNSVVIGKTLITNYGAEHTAKAIEKFGFTPKFVKSRF